MGVLKEFETRELDIAERHIVDCIRAYPNLYRNRFSVLEHIFLVNGNGYEWDYDLQAPVTDAPSSYHMDEKQARYMASDMFDYHPPSSLYPESKYAKLHKVDKYTNLFWLAQAKEFCGACLYLEDQWASIGQIKSRICGIRRLRIKSTLKLSDECPHDAQGKEFHSRFVEWKVHFQRVCDI